MANLELKDLLPGKTYALQVRAKNENGELSEWSNTYTFTAPIDTTQTLVNVYQSQIGGDGISNPSSGALKSANFNGSLNLGVGGDPEDFSIKTTAGKINPTFAGTTGWAIDYAGNAIFSNALIRGTIQAGNVTIGKNAITVLGTDYPGLKIDNNNYWYLNGSSQGVFSLGGASGITYSGSGNVQIGTGVTIAGTVTATAFQINSYNYWNSPTYGSPNDFRIGDATNYVLWDDSANSLNVVGAITATTGTIGGFSIGANSLTAGTAGNSVGLNTTGYPFYAGNATPASAPFRVTSAGAVTATSGSIGGWTLGASSLTSGTGTSAVALSTGPYSFYAGDATPESAPFSVTNSGIIKASSGTIGGWTISSSEISSGTGSTKVGLDASGKKIYVGSGAWSDPATGFYVDSDGRFSLKDRLIFDPGDSQSFGTLTVIGRIRGAIENTLIVPTDSNTFTVSQVVISGTTTKTAVLTTTASHTFIVGDTVVVSSLTGNAAAANGAWQITAKDSTTFTITIGTSTNGTYTGQAGTAKVRELTLGLHAALNGSPAGLGIRLDENNYWFLNNRFRIGNALNYVDWAGDQLTVRGFINNVYLGRGGNDATETNFAIGRYALDVVNLTGTENIAIGQSVLTNNNAGSKNVGIGSESLLTNFDGIGNTALGYRALYTNYTGDYNTAAGFEALYFNISNLNTAIGFKALRTNTSGSSNTAIGAEALSTNATGINNVAIGSGALKFSIASNNVAIGSNAMSTNNTGSSNVAIGADALSSNYGGTKNLGIGYQALYSNGDGAQNLALGSQALYTNTTGNYNTAIGTDALYFNDTANFNTAIGFGALKNNLGGSNTAIGYQALNLNTSGNKNLAIGYRALASNNDGIQNLALGELAMEDNSSGQNNIALGYAALASNTSGIDNIAIGIGALTSAGAVGSTAQYNMAIGNYALSSAVSGTSNVAIGGGALSSNNGSQNIAIGLGAAAVVTGANGNLFIGGNDGTGYETATNNIVISDGVGNIRIKSSSAGAITMPSNPLFSATDTRALDLTNVVLTSANCYDQVDYNIGSCFNASNGRFTAPVAGYYEASAHFGSPTANTINVRIRKNGAANTGPLVEIYNQTSSGSTNNYARAIIYLAASDYIDFECARLTTLSGIQHKRFLIRLVQ